MINNVAMRWAFFFIYICLWLLVQFKVTKELVNANIGNNIFLAAMVFIISSYVLGLASFKLIDKEFD